MGSTKETVKSDAGTTGASNTTAASGNASNTVTVSGNTVTAKKSVAKANDSVYTVSELAQNAKKLFDTMPECVAAALKLAGITSCTVEEARVIVKNFLNQEVN